MFRDRRLRTGRKLLRAGVFSDINGGGLAPQPRKKATLGSGFHSFLKTALQASSLKEEAHRTNVPPEKQTEWIAQRMGKPLSTIEGVFKAMESPKNIPRNIRNTSLRSTAVKLALDHVKHKSLRAALLTEGKSRKEADDIIAGKAAKALEGKLPPGIVLDKQAFMERLANRRLKLSPAPQTPRPKATPPATDFNRVRKVMDSLPPLLKSKYLQEFAKKHGLTVEQAKTRLGLN